jgi:uncharacterized phage protein (TIGR01671 family)
MREIKFRVWDKKNKQMYYGYEPNRPNMITFDGEICAQTLKGMDMYGNPLAKMDYYPQERFILMQYTVRKDKNKNEVYEGDILQREGEWSIRIEFEKGIFFVRDLNRIRYINKITNIPMALFEIEKYEIIGNIYQNPELLEEEK